MIKVFIDGFITGSILQLAIGPVFFFLLNIFIQRTIIDGVSAVLAVTIGDYIYIAFAIIGLGKTLEKKNWKKKLSIISAIVLFIYGVIIIISNMRFNNILIENKQPSNVLNSFLSAFFLTISNPLTIVFWNSLFASKALEKNYPKKQLICFGIAAGFATVLFLGSLVITLSIIKTSIPYLLVVLLNVCVGLLLIIYAIKSFIKEIRYRTYQ